MVKQFDEKLERALGSDKVVGHEGFRRFAEKAGGVPRGTIIAGERVILGYPKIRRIFSLETGVERNFESAELVAEEKIDGYNVRAAMHAGGLVCFSRGGYVDHFAMEKLGRDQAVKKFFSSHRGMVLFGEMVGNTPHTAPTDEYDVKYYVFDILDGEGEFLGPMERREFCKESGLLPVPLVGVFKRGDVGKLKAAASRLDREGKEGMVLRGTERREMVKYVTPSSDINDLAENSAKIFDMPAGFMKQRVFRSAVSIRELGLKREKYSARLGEALYSGLTDALSVGQVEEKFRVRVEDPHTWDRIREGMGKEIEIRVDRNGREGKGYEIEFTKVFREGSKRVRRALEGHPQED